jgi:hypothetical protein
LLESRVIVDDPLDLGSVDDAFLLGEIDSPAAADALSDETMRLLALGRHGS